MPREDTFFTQNHCDRCKTTPLTSRTMSWWTEETICMECEEKEAALKKALRAAGIPDAMEGCGYIPEFPKPKEDKP